MTEKLKLYRVHESGYRTKEDTPANDAYVIATSPSEALRIFINKFGESLSIYVDTETREFLMEGQ